ncbi:MAG: hypothetical protein ACR2QK_21890, partial [Acidimicrobiales bacterium]
MKPFVSVLVAILIALVNIGPAAAQSTDDEIQILNVERDDAGRVAVEIAIPASIGDLAPVAQNFAVVVDGQ